MKDNSDELKQELAELKQEFNQRIDCLASKIAQLSTETESCIAESVEVSPLSALAQQSAAEQAQKTAKNTLIDKKSSTVNNTKTIHFIFALFSKLILLFSFLSIFQEWLRPIAKIYKSYQQRGMAGIFLITLIGVALTLLGVGYLMQLLIDQLDSGIKSLLMGFAATIIIFIGIKLKGKTQFSEFATALVALGVLVAYSTVYFTGSVYQLLPSIAVLFLYLFVALSSHVLALYLDTKVLASLGITGIATMPLFSGTVAYVGNYYLLSLAFVTASSLILAYKKLGAWLANLTMIFTLLAIEWLVNTPTHLISAWLVDLFYLLFFSYLCFSCFKQQAKLAQLFIIMAATISATIMLFFQTSGFISSTVTLLYAINAALAIGVAVFFYISRHQLTKMLVLIAATWLVFAIISAINNNYWGIAWAAEGLLLLYTGRRFALKAVINQGQWLIAAALIYSYGALDPYFPLPALKTFDGWLLAVVIALVIGLWQRLITHGTLFNHFTQEKIKPTLQLLEVVWLSALIIASSAIFIGEWTGALVILLQVAILFRARHCQNVGLEYFAALLIAAPLFYIAQASLLTHSLYFSDLALFAKVAAASAFAQLWLWAAYYRQYYPSSALASVAEKMRTLFYLLLPVFWLGSAFRHLGEYFVSILWLSPLLASLFAYRYKQTAFFIETKLLTVLASLTVIVLLGSNHWLSAIIATLGFTVFYTSAIFFNKRFIKKLILRKLSYFIVSWGIVTLGIALPIAVGWLANDAYSAYLVASIYWLACLAFINKIVYLKRNQVLITSLNILLILVAWKLSFAEGIKFMLMPASFLLLLSYQYKQQQRLGLINRLTNYNVDILLHSITAISYSFTLLALTTFKLELLIAPALVLHGIVILLTLSDRLVKVKFAFVLIILGIAKLALIDAASGVLWQKVVLFIGIGVFMLFSAFWYQKLLAKIITEK
ncbi:MAG: DUF2339 domain-containing protein [Alteromonadaceae bacterium]|nr:DUF2339 domain-containing protein [Alteromonadaceae bacterium]